MAQVLIDIDASTKQFESALDELTAKVKSTAAQMDKAFAVNGNAEKQIRNTSNAVGELHNALRDISVVAAGNVLAEAFSKPFKKIKELGNEIFRTTEQMQGLEMAMKSIVSSDAIKSGKYKDYAEAIQHAEKDTADLMAWIKKLSLVSPYEYTDVIDAFKQNANMGQSVETAKKTTKAILELGSGLGMAKAQMKGFSMALAQTGATQKITATDLRQFANNGFGMDKLNDIFGRISEKYNIVIGDHNDFNNAVKSGKITIEDFFDALGEYADQNYGGAVEAMASTIGGLKSSLGDIKTNAINDLFLEASKTISKTLKPYIEYLMEMLTSGNFTEWGKGINEWVQGIVAPFQKIGELMEKGTMMTAMAQIRDFFSGKSLNLGGVEILMKTLMGENYNDDWYKTLFKIKDIFEWFLEHKGVILDSIKGIGVAFGVALSTKAIGKFASILMSLNNPATRLAAIGSLIGIAWNKNFLGIQDRVKGLIDYVNKLHEAFNKDKLSGVWEEIKNSATNTWREVEKLWDGSDLLQKLMPSDRMTKTLKDSFKYIYEVSRSALNVMTLGNSEHLINYFGELYKVFDAEGFTGAWEKLRADIINGFNGTVSDIVSYGQKLVKAFDEDGISGVVTVIATDIQQYLTDSISTYTELLKGHYETLKENALQIIGDIFHESGLANVSETLGDFETMFSPVLNSLSETFTKTLGDTITVVVGKFKELSEIFRASTWITFGENLAKIAGILAVIVLLIGDIALGSVADIVEGIGRTFIDVINTAQSGMDAINALAKLFKADANGSTDLALEATTEFKHSAEDFGEAIAIGIKEFLFTVIDIIYGMVLNIADEIPMVDVTAQRESWKNFKEANTKYAQDQRTWGMDEVDNAYTIHRIYQDEKKRLQEEGIDAEISLSDIIPSFSDTALFGRKVQDDTLDFLVTKFGDELTEKDKAYVEQYKMYGDANPENVYKDFVKFFSGNSFAMDYMQTVPIEHDLLGKSAEERTWEDFMRVTGYRLSDDTEDVLLKRAVEGIEEQKAIQERNEKFAKDQIDAQRLTGKTLDKYISQYNAWQMSIGKPSLSSEQEKALRYEDEYRTWVESNQRYSAETQQNFDTLYEMLKGNNADNVLQWLRGEAQNSSFDAYGWSDATKGGALGFLENAIRNGWDKSALGTYMQDFVSKDLSRSAFASQYNGVNAPDQSFNNFAHVLEDTTEKTKELGKEAENTTGNMEGVTEATGKATDSVTDMDKNIADWTGKVDLAQSIASGNYDIQAPKVNFSTEASNALEEVTDSIAEVGKEIEEKEKSPVHMSVQIEAPSSSSAPYRFYREENALPEEKTDLLQSRAISGESARLMTYVTDTLPEELTKALQTEMDKYEDKESLEKSDFYQEISKFMPYLSGLLEDAGNGWSESGLASAIGGNLNMMDLWQYLPEEVFKSITDVLNANDEVLNIDILTKLGEAIETAVNNVGVDVKEIADETSGTGEVKEEKSDWDIFGRSRDAHMDEFMSEYTTLVRTQMVENGYLKDDPNKFQNSDKKTNKEYAKAFSDAFFQLLADGATENAPEAVKAMYDAFTEEFGKQSPDGGELIGGNYGLGSGVEQMFGQRNTDVYLGMSTMLDGFREVTKENFAEAQKWLNQEDKWQKFAEDVRFGTRENTNGIINEMGLILEGLGQDPAWVSTLQTELRAEIKDLDPDAQLAKVRTAIRELDSSIDLFHADNKDGLATVASQVAGKGSVSVSNAAKDKAKDLIDQYNQATGAEKDDLGYRIQALMDATAYASGGKYNWNLANNGENGKLLLTDLFSEDPKKQQKTYEKWMEQLGTYGYSQNIYEASQKSLFEQQSEKLRKYEEARAALDAADLSSEEYEKQKQALDDAFKADSISGVMGLFDEDTVKNIEKLIGAGGLAALFNGLETAAAEGWTNMSTAIAALGTAIPSIATALKEGIDKEALASIWSSITSEQVAVWKEAADPLMRVSNALVKMADSLERLRKLVGQVDVGAQIPDVTNKAKGWETFGNAIEKMANAWRVFAGFKVNLKDIIPTLKEETVESYEKIKEPMEGLASALGTIKNVFAKGEGGTMFSLKGLIPTLDEKVVKSWTEISTPLWTVSEALSSIKSVFTADETGNVFSLSNLIPVLNQDAVDSWTNVATPLWTASEAFASMKEVFSADESGNVFSLNGLIPTIDEEAVASWVTIAEPLGAVANAMNMIKTVLLGEQGMGGLGTDFSLASLFPTLETATIDSWTIFSTSLASVKDSLVAIMVALTGGTMGEDGEMSLGNADAGQMFSDALTSMGDAAEKLAPRLEEKFLPDLDRMANSLSLADSSTNNLIQQWTGSWKTAVQAFVKETAPAIDTADALGASANAAAGYYANWAAQIRAVINALKELAEIEGKKEPKHGTNNGDGSHSHEFAGGTHGFRYGTAIVGEHGPELITTGSTALNVFSNTQLMDEIAHTRHALNMLSNSASLVAYNRLMGSGSSNTSNDNSQHFTNNFTGAILGDDAFREMIDEEVREVWRREMRLAS